MVSEASAVFFSKRPWHYFLSPSLLRLSVAHLTEKAKASTETLLVPLSEAQPFMSLERSNTKGSPLKALLKVGLSLFSFLLVVT